MANFAEKSNIILTTFHDLIVARRSIRRYTDEPIEPGDVKLILEAALLAPTSKSARDWQFVAVEDPQKLSLLAGCKPHGANPIEGCRLAIAVLGNPELSDAWVEDASIAAAYIQLQAADLGLGSCWIQVRGRFTADDIPSEEYIQEQLGIPDTLPVLCVITLGHPAEERKPQNVEKLLWERVHIGQWKGE